MYFDIDAHKDCFKTNENKAYFWHGQTDGYGGQNNAMSIASENNGKTLEMCMLENRNELERAGVNFEDFPNGSVNISYGVNDDENTRFWEDCSKAFAEQASGNVRVIEGTDPRPNGQPESAFPSVYNRIERPALEENQNVSGITHINPFDGRETGYEPINHKNSEQNSFELTGTNSQSVAAELGGGSQAPPRYGALPPQNNADSESSSKINDGENSGKYGKLPDEKQSSDNTSKDNSDTSKESADNLKMLDEKNQNPINNGSGNNNDGLKP